MGRGQLHWTRQAARRGVTLDEPDFVVLLVDELNRAAGSGIIIPDLYAEILEARRLDVPLSGLDRLGKSDLFLLLRQLMAKGLIERSDDGYSVTLRGGELAEERRTREHATLPRIREAATTAALRAS
jgi:hypothetical protein